MNEDKPARLPFGDILGPEPKWLLCRCGAASARVPCWDCAAQSQAREAGDERRRAGERTIPEEFRWSTLASPLLLCDRVRLPPGGRTLEQLASAILAAHRVVIGGGSGSGKTSLLVACLRERLAGGAIFVNATDLGTARIQHDAGDGEALLVEHAIRAPLAFLDDVGEEVHTATNAVRDVIRARHNASRPTWISTGLRTEELVARYGDGIRRRMLERALGSFAVRLGPAITVDS